MICPSDLKPKGEREMSETNATATATERERIENDRITYWGA